MNALLSTTNEEIDMNMGGRDHHADIEQVNLDVFFVLLTDKRYQSRDNSTSFSQQSIRVR